MVGKPSNMPRQYQHQQIVGAVMAGKGLAQNMTAETVARITGKT